MLRRVAVNRLRGTIGVGFRRQLVHHGAQIALGEIPPVVHDFRERQPVDGQQAGFARAVHLRDGVELAQPGGIRDARDLVVFADRQHRRCLFAEFGRPGVETAGAGALLDRNIQQTLLERQVSPVLISPALDHPRVGAPGQRGEERSQRQAQHQQVSGRAERAALAPQAGEAQVGRNGAQAPAQPGHRPH